ncbi:MAG: PD-(D/E)XK nuclease family protein [Acidimicrobiales bacterium]|mgnify:CR=1 FL=1|jgi:putative RecB family exonuclease|nr:PD-(D/E)XK nuclease family protein [Acidimicrobiales bacterium]MDP6299127.1 PD-(D/E)XK nuclease family protein [Acidimicrobiales bacterium]HJM28369.1 PD-(D/E)XK nuclease family protein [Acidimicrobiales bacterium]HJM96783.1 PD-(D/E)XK nuclease family protein [Acidimicrobiales bacterium]
MVDEVKTVGGNLPPYLSSSSSSMFDQCPSKWKFRYVDKLPDPPGEPALLGTFAHEVLEFLLQEAPECRTKERAKELAAQIWPKIENNDDFLALELDDAEIKEFKWKSWNAIEGLWKLEDPSKVEVKDTERDVRVMLGGVPFRGVIDRVDKENQRLVVADYKSGKPPKKRFAGDKLNQVLLYAAAIREADGELPNKARLLFLGQEIIETEVSEETLKAPIGKLQDIWNELNLACDSDTFPSKTGPLCAWCPFVTYCPDGEEEVRQRLSTQRVRQDAPALSALGLI